MQKHFLEPANEQSKAGQIIERFVLCLFAMMNLIIVFQAMQRLFGKWNPLQYTLQYALMAGYIFAAVLGCWLIMRMSSSPTRVLGAIIFLSLAVRLFLVATIPTEPISDFNTMYESARSIAAGDFSQTHSQSQENYFYHWGYQIPFMLYEAVILRLFRSILALKLFNVLFMVGTNYLIYRIGILFLSETAALSVALIYAIFPDALILTTVLTNQHIALFFLLLGVLLLLQAKRKREFVLAGLCLAVSDLMRPEVVIILAACLCCGMLRFIQSPHLATLKQLAISLVPLLVCYWLTKGLVERLLVWTDIAPYGIQNRIPEWKFVLGLGNVEGYGTYSLEHVDIFTMDSTERRAITTELIGDLFHRPITEIVKFFYGKLRVFWNDDQAIGFALAGTNQNHLIISGLGLKLSHLSSMLQWSGRGIQPLTYLLTLPVPVLLWRNDKRHGTTLFCTAAVFVMIFVFLIIEVQPRYRLIAGPFLLLLGGVTIEWLTSFKFRKGGHDRKDVVNDEKTNCRTGD